MRLTSTPARCRTWAGGILGGSVLAVILLMPQANLLPQAPMDSMNAFFLMPPGGTIDMVREEIAASRSSNACGRTWTMRSSRTFAATTCRRSAHSMHAVHLPRGSESHRGDDQHRPRPRCSLTCRIRRPSCSARQCSTSASTAAARSTSTCRVRTSTCWPRSHMQAMPIINQAMPGAMVRPMPSLGDCGAGAAADTKRSPHYGSRPRSWLGRDDRARF